MMTKPDSNYKHALMSVAQACKENMLTCGDLVLEERSADAATFLVLDGIGSGMKAGVAARLFGSRLLSLLRHGFTSREACARVMESAHAARTQDVLFAAFTLVRVAPNGLASIMSYEMPPPLIIEGDSVAIAEQRFFTLGNELAGESFFMLQPRNGLLICSDGVTQAGLGRGVPSGWTINGARDFAAHSLASGEPISRLPQLILEQSRKIGCGSHGDDTTAVLLTCRPGSSVHILTGPPGNPVDDQPFVRKFLDADGTKIVCGSTTAVMVARCAGRKVSTGSGDNPFEPPEHFIEGLDLVTEGAITLNQLYNLLEQPPMELEPDSTVSKLLLFLRQADRIYFYVGRVRNPGHGSQIFKQLGVLPRSVIVPLIAEKFRAEGKLVLIEEK